MKNLLLILLLSWPDPGILLPEDFHSDFEAAIQFLHQQEALLQAGANEFPDNDPKEVLAIIAPELIRYELFRDFFETKALEIAYVKGGSNIVDFSIGRFQMKPSFIEEIEYHIHHHPSLAETYGPMIDYPAQSTPTAIRRLRIERLKDFAWQIRYAHLFYKMTNDCFSGLETSGEFNRLAFIATAYNYGFSRPVEEIHRYMSIRAFPYGQQFDAPQLSYGEWSQLFYQRI